MAVVDMFRHIFFWKFAHRGSLAQQIFKMTAAVHCLTEQLQLAASLCFDLNGGAARLAQKIVFIAFSCRPTNHRRHCSAACGALRLRKLNTGGYRHPRRYYLKGLRFCRAAYLNKA